MVIKIKFPTITRGSLATLQVNLGYKCNQTCSHCHVDAGPHRKEMMSNENILLLLKVIKEKDIKLLDITGGAPELHPLFKMLVSEAKKLEVDIIDRCNLTVLLEKGYEDMPSFLASNDVIIVASLPCYEEENVDQQRGLGVFKKSIKALKILNKIGYGQKDSSLKLNLIYNPSGPFLPPEQNSLEKIFKSKLYQEYGIVFNNLFVLTNMPIKRFANQLIINGQLKSYMETLKNSFRKENLENVMCKNLISVDWQGLLYDCDFNQQLKMSLLSKSKHLNDLIKTSINGEIINVADHCFACTAGNGSSCNGETINNK